MNGFARFIASSVLIAASMIAGRWFVVVPNRVNLSKKTIEMRTSNAIENQGAATAVLLARTNLEQLDVLEANTPGDVEIYMLEGANLRLLGRLPEAATAYRTALQFDRRPEIYLNLGLTLAAMGSRTEAIDALATAVQFSPVYVRSISDQSLRSPATRLAQSRQERK